METAVDVLKKIRQPLAEYQKERGLPKDEQISFINLLTAICQHAYNASVTIFNMLYSLLPLVDGFLYFLRFLLDKTIDILETGNLKDRIIKIVVFLCELIAIVVLLVLIISLILLPIINLMSHFGRKVANLFYL